MATKGSTYAQDMPEGVKKHRAHTREMAEAAKSQRAKKGRGNGKRYCYNGIKGQYPSTDAVVTKPIKILAG